MRARLIASIGALAILSLPAPATADAPPGPASTSPADRVKPRVLDVASTDHAVLGDADCVGRAAEHEPHLPITIASDADLASPVAGVRTGTGAADDPYVISGWLFAGQGDLTAEGLGHAIRISGTTKHIVIKENVILGTGYPQGLDVGIHVSAPNVTIEANTICSTINDGIFADGAEGALIKNNEITDTRAGIWSFGSDDVQVVENDVDTSLFGIALDESPRAAIERNRVETLALLGTGTVGIVANYSNGVRISNNTVTGPHETADDQGINVYSSTGPVLTANTVSGVGSFGLIVGYAQDGLIEHNRSVDNGLAGLLLWDDWVVGGNVVRGGDYSGNGSYGASLVEWTRSGVVVLDTDANLLQDVKAERNLVHGVFVFGSDWLDTPGPDPIHDTVVRGAVATRNQYGFGVATDRDEGTVITGMRATGNGGGGISLLDSEALVESNDIAENSGTGVRIAGGGDTSGPVVRDNAVTSNHRGIHLLYAFDATLTDNVVDDNDYGFGIDGRTVEHYRNRIDASTTVDGRRVLVLEDATGEVDAGALDAAYLALVRPTGVVVRGLDAAKQMRGLTIFGGSGVRVESPRLTGNEIGIDVIRSDDVAISGGTLEDNATGVRPLGDSTAVTIADSTFRGGDIGIDIQWLNEIPDIGFGQPDGTTITGNVFEGVRRRAIDMSGPNTTIVGNRIVGPTDIAINLETGPTAILDNQIRGPGDRGIEITSYFTTIRGNLISGFERAISSWHGANTIVEDNLLRGNGTGYFSTGAANSSALRRNVIADNQRGVVIQGEAWDVVLDCNRIVGNADEGIRTYILTFRPQISNNVIERNGTGLRVDSTLGGITGNRIRFNTIGLLYDRLASLPSFPATGNDIVGNERWGATALLAGNDTLVGVGTVAAESVTGNWWGDPNGPFAQTNRLGRGDQVSDQLNYRNWLTAPAGTGTCADALPQ